MSFGRPTVRQPADCQLDSASTLVPAGHATTDTSTVTTSSGASWPRTAPSGNASLLSCRNDDAGSSTIAWTSAESRSLTQSPPRPLSSGGGSSMTIVPAAPSAPEPSDAVAGRSRSSASQFTQIEPFASPGVPGSSDTLPMTSASGSPGPGTTWSPDMNANQIV